MKTPKKSLVSAIIFAGLSLTGCSKTTTCYDLPNEEKVCIENSFFGSTNTGNRFIVTKTDGRIIKFNYRGKLDMPNIDYVEITKDKKTKKYSQLEILEEAKKQVIEYSKIALKDETEKGLKDLK